MPTFAYRLRMWATLKFCGSPSKLCSPPEPKKPLAGLRLVAALAGGHGVGGPGRRVEEVSPSCWSPVVSELSRARTGFGGSMISSAKSANFCISAA